MGHALPLVSLCKALAQRGHQVTFAASSGSPAANSMIGSHVGWVCYMAALEGISCVDTRVFPKIVVFPPKSSHV